jgi:hypothetical protein
MIFGDQRRQLLPNLAQMQWQNDAILRQQAADLVSIYGP